MRYDWGVFHENHGHDSQAQTIYQQGLKTHPTYVAFYRGLARLALEQQQWHTAQHWIQQALEQGPMTPTDQCLLQALLGRMHWEGFGNAAAAQQAYVQALAAVPHHFSSLTALGKLLVATGTDGWQQMALYYEQALAATPLKSRIYWHWGRFLEQHQLEAALLLYQHAQKVCGNLIFEEKIAQLQRQ